MLRGKFLNIFFRISVINFIKFTLVILEDLVVLYELKRIQKCPHNYQKPQKNSHQCNRSGSHRLVVIVTTTDWTDNRLPCQLNNTRTKCRQTVRAGPEQWCSSLFPTTLRTSNSIVYHRDTHGSGLYLCLCVQEIAVQHRCISSLLAGCRRPLGEPGMHFCFIEIVHFCASQLWRPTAGCCCHHHHPHLVMMPQCPPPRSEEKKVGGDMA